MFNIIFYNGFYSRYLISLFMKIVKKGMKIIKKDLKIEIFWGLKRGLIIIKIIFIINSSLIIKLFNYYCLNFKK